MPRSFGGNSCDSNKYLENYQFKRSCLGATLTITIRFIYIVRKTHEILRLRMKLSQCLEPKGCLMHMDTNHQPFLEYVLSAYIILSPCELILTLSLNEVILTVPLFIDLEIGTQKDQQFAQIPIISEWLRLAFWQSGSKVHAPNQQLNKIYYRLAGPFSLSSFPLWS